MLALFESLASDYFAMKGLPVASGVATTAALAIQRLLNKRAETAREILLEEIRFGREPLTAISEDESAAIVLRYMRTAQEGAARLNLRLLAAVISGKAAAGNLKADEFLHWASILESLSREEIFLLGIFSRYQENPPPTNDESAPAFIVWNASKRMLEQEYEISDELASATAYALLRTGLVVMVEGAMDLPMVPAPSAHLREIRSLLSIEGVLDREVTAIVDR